MKYRIIYTVLCVSAIVLSHYSCSNFEEINTNPNATEKVTSAMIATSQIKGIVDPGTAKPFAESNMLSKHLAWGEGANGNQYNNLGRTGTGDLTVLPSLQKMVEGTTDANRDAYTGLALFIKAYRLFFLSMSLGDIPYSEAGKGEDGNITPKYDTQKDVMVQVLKDLETAEGHFAVAKNFDGDFVQKGDVAVWRRITNSFRLKVLMYLSKKESDTDLNIKTTFSKIVKGSPLLENNNQNLQLVFSSKANQIYPVNKVNTKHYAYGIISNVLTENFKRLNDYRLFYYADPSTYAIQTEKKAEDDWAAYPGIDPSMPYDEMKTLYSTGKYCGFNSRYINYEPGEPVMRVGFTEQNFIIAEAIVRGWVDGDAEAYYKAGVRAAMKFTATNTPVAYCHNREITDAYIEEYLLGEGVKFASTADERLKQIWLQKYFVHFLQFPWEAYYEYRRNGYPVLPINPKTNLNEVSDKIPVRWMYPEKEYNLNSENLGVALDRQFNGQDKVNDLMWILK